MPQPAPIAAWPATVAAELALQHHEGRAILEHLGRDAGHAGRERGAAQSVQPAPCSGPAAQEGEQREAVPVWRSAVDVGAPQPGHPLGHGAIGQYGAERRQHHACQEMAQQVARRGGSRVQAIEHASLRGSHCHRAEAALVVRHVRRQRHLEAERGVRLCVVVDDVDRLLDLR